MSRWSTDAAGNKVSRNGATPRQPMQPDVVLALHPLSAYLLSWLRVRMPAYRVAPSDALCVRCSTSFWTFQAALGSLMTT
jgi:hypothetical protein